MNLRLAALLFLAVFVRESLHSQQEDQECLQEFKNSVSDPTNSLSSWQFSQDAPVCSLTGITCLHANDTVYGIDLQLRGLLGNFPKGLSKCKSITTLDLSGNSFSGPLPDRFCQQIPFLVKLDLQRNSFSGGISSSTFENCTYLNEINLSENKLTGPIPGEIGFLGRLTTFDVSSNSFSGPIPGSLSNISSKNFRFQGNPQLCGPPLKNTCTGGGSKSSAALVAGLAAGGVVALIAAAIVIACFIVPKKKIKPGTSKPGSDGDRWAKRIRAPQSIPVAMFEASPVIQKMKLTDLLLATDNFSSAHIIGSGRTGVVYRANFPDGSVLAIKRLRLATPAADKGFRSEMETLARLRHRNLVPLLGFCIADAEKLLVYEYMPNGSLKDRLRPVEDCLRLDWPKRLKIAIGAARGLAWLHHSCNPRIIHRNISSSSLLLDGEMEARITDFGLARLMNPVDTHISTCVNGDFGDVGYVAPEYVRTLVATARGDVFSFGVLLLEIITGQGAVEVVSQDAFKGNLLEWVAMHSQNGTLASVLDVWLMKGGDVSAEEKGELMQFLKIGFCCCAVNPKERPSAFEVYQLLRAIGQRYHFSDQNDEMPLGISVDLDDQPSELIVSSNSRPEDQV